MSILIEILAKNTHWLWLLCIIWAIYNLRQAFLARRERKAARFSLEKEAAQARLYRTWGWSAALFFFLGFTLYLQLAISPGLENPPPAQESASNVLPLPTPTPTPKPTPTPIPTPPRPPTPPMIYFPTPELTPTPTPLPPCPNPGVVITSPGVNATIRGPVEIKGTANIPNFQFYKLEFGAGQNPQLWSFILSGNTPVVGGTLGIWDPSPLPPGEYRLRLVVVDITGNYPPPCEIPIRIQR
ncbi:MAG: hypothetical protein RMK30_02675 [Anaerolineae bacterium]|nr:hypothetical protein [Anaerolineae bacterium]MDW8101758.1 hypothetical protein [Anaerolineae bacterium]